MAKKLYLVEHPRNDHRQPTFITSNKIIAFIAANLWIGHGGGGFSTKGSYRELTDDDAVPMKMSHAPLHEVAQAKEFLSEKEYKKLDAAMCAQEVFELTEAEWAGYSENQQDEAMKWGKRAHIVFHKDKNTHQNVLSDDLLRTPRNVVLEN